MPSNKEKQFEAHIVGYLTDPARQGMRALPVSELTDREYHIVPSELFIFLRDTQPETLRNLEADYGADTEAEVLRHIQDAVRIQPLWLLIRNGLEVRHQKFQLYYPKPHNNNAPLQTAQYRKNRFTLKSQYHFDAANPALSIDLVIWLNGLPIVTLELKHPDEGQTVVDAIQQYADRNHDNRVFELPFWHIAADTQDVKAATRPVARFFQWLNAGLENQPTSPDEYPVEHLYRDLLATDTLLAFLESYLIYVPSEKRIESGGMTTIEPGYTLFPRYHQLRSARTVAQHVSDRHTATGKLGLKQLIYHSAGSGKTLTMSWMADRLHALHHPVTDAKVFDIIFILTDRRSLDKNIKDDLVKFRHLFTDPNNPVVAFTERSNDLRVSIQKRRAIIVTTLQKFAYVQDLLKQDADLQKLNVAFLLDEAHRSQDGKLSEATREPFTRTADQPDADKEPEETEGEIVQKLKLVNLNNQVVVAFTATPTQNTLSIFGDPVDVYYEDEAIREGYILDVAANIISYKTLYNLGSKAALPETEYPSGVVAKALRDVAFRDEDLIRYKSEIIVRLFGEKVESLLDGQAKAMVVTSSRPSGLLYYRIIQQILNAKGSSYKALYAFSDFSQKDDNGTVHDYTEAGINGIVISDESGGKLIEDYFAEDEYRILVVANKFQTGFNQPKLCAMFLDKAVKGVNAVQTVSRLNRQYKGLKRAKDLLVVDFTNNSDAIFKAFKEYRKDVPYEPVEPDPALLDQLRQRIVEQAVFSDKQISAYATHVKVAEEEAVEKRQPAIEDARLQNLTVQYRKQFDKQLPDRKDRREYLGQLSQFVRLSYFLSNFFNVSAHRPFRVVAEVLGPQLIPTATQTPLSELLKDIYLERAAVIYVGQKANDSVEDSEKKSHEYKPLSGSTEPSKTTVADYMNQLREKFPISDDEAVVIRQIRDDILANEQLIAPIRANYENADYVQSQIGEIEKAIRTAYIERLQFDKLDNQLYVSRNGIIPLTARQIVEHLVEQGYKPPVIYKRQPGLWKGQVQIPDNFNDPLDDLRDYML